MRASPLLFEPVCTLCLSHRSKQGRFCGHGHGGDNHHPNCPPRQSRQQPRQARRHWRLFAATCHRSCLRLCVAIASLLVPSSFLCTNSALLLSCAQQHHRHEPRESVGDKRQPARQFHSDTDNMDLFATAYRDTGEPHLDHVVVKHLLCTWARDADCTSGISTMRES